MSTGFIPAAHFHILTPLYDIFVRLAFGRIFKHIVKIINPQPHEKILDIGCGPGNIILALKQYEPQARITGLDIDPAILKIAQKKFKKAHIDAKLVEASATDIPLVEQFDVVVSTLMFHHLNFEQKNAMAKEAHRLLKKGGRFYLYDFAPPRNFFEKIAAAIFRHIEDIDDGVAGKYKSILERAGLRNVISKYQTTLLELLEARKA